MENKKIVCLDDCPLTLKRLEKTFSQYGYQVFTTTEWAKLTPLIFREKIPILLIDVHMPGVSGEKITTVLKQNLPQLKVIFFSSIPEKELQQLAQKYNADGWISKSSPPQAWLQEVENALQEQHNLRSKTILCLDDDPLFLKKIQSLLEHKGYQVIVAKSYLEARKYLLQQSCGLVLLDILLPGLQGDKICQLIKSTSPNIKVVYLSILSEKELQNYTQQTNADSWINKENITQIPEKIQTLLSSMEV
ncbi:MAG: response regulator [Planctomycetota bacterium]|nr:MAG: response regulator [Planctomycetota bacterium]